MHALLRDVPNAQARVNLLRCRRRRYNSGIGSSTGWHSLATHLTAARDERHYSAAS